MAPLTARTLWSLPRVGLPVPAGDDQVVVPVTTYDLDANAGRTRLWLVPLDGSPPRPVTDPVRSATKPTVDAAGRQLAFLREEGGAQVNVMPLDGGEPEQVTDLPLGALGARWLPDGSGLVVVALVDREHPGLEETRRVRDERAAARARPHVTEDAVYRYWDLWLTTGEVPHLFHLDLASRALRDLTPEGAGWMRWSNTDDPLDDVAVSPDGAEVAFVVETSPPPHRNWRWDLFTVPLAGGPPRILTAHLTGPASRPRYTPDGRHLVYGMQRIADFYADRVRIVAYERTSGEHRVLTEDWDRSAAAWEPAGDHLVVAAEDGARQPLWTLPLAGGSPERLASGGTLSGPVVTAAGTVVAQWSSLSHPPEIVRVEGGRLERVTQFTAGALDGVEMGAVDDLTFAGAGGDPVQMFLLHPPGGNPGPSPLVHLIHGGPHGIFGDAWSWRWCAQVVAGAGYRVALVNFHGSTSFGQEFAASIHGSWGDRPAADVEAATDHLVAAGLADPDRVAIAGGSYGGYLVAWLTSQTGRYRCAIAHAAATNLAGMYASDVTFGRARAYGAEVFEDPARVERWSPAAHAAGYATPTLVVHGERDYRVPVTQGLELYGVLKAKAVEARLVYYPDENHWILSSANSLHWYGEVLGWLARHLG